MYAHFFLSFFRPKNYILGLKTENNDETESEIKCRGFFLNGFKAKSQINAETYQKFVKALESGDMSQRKLVPQFRIGLNTKSRKMVSKTVLKAFKNSIYEKRLIVTKEKHCIMTVPYGFTSKLLEEVGSDMKLLKHA